MLTAAVCWIDEPKKDAKHSDKRHLVSAINVPSSYLKSQSVSSSTFIIAILNVYSFLIFKNLYNTNHRER